ncbi:MAG: polyketide synthase dehydratase domain-containing protein, partial [Actinobacteria bacterium]|nr:polyketide synthase dehydratase domain-containing protein [Actinomycetota bacterium]
MEAIATYIRRLSEALKVNHPALAPIADAGDTDDRVYVATALIDGATLAHHIRDHGRLTPPAAVELLRGLADGLDRVHAAGIVHGAISPRTILIRSVSGSAPSAVLRGFGIDTLLARQARLDRDRIDIRDVEYVAPEQLHGSAVDGRADQYALACALHHCIVGAPPFIRETASAMFGAHLFSEAPPVPVTNHPALLDAAFQVLGSAVSGSEPGPAGPLVPTALARIECFGETGEACWSHAVVTRSESDAIEGEVRLLDDSGRILVRCR